MRDTENIYNIFIAFVFGCSALNIIALVTRPSQPGRKGLTIGEILAIAVVILSICFLGLEMLHLYHIFPIKLQTYQD